MKKNLTRLLSVSAFALLVGYAAFAYAQTCSTCTGNELMYLGINNLDTLAAASVDATADYVPVYDASTKHTKKVLASAISSVNAPADLTATTVLDSTYCGKRILMDATGASKTFTLPASTGSGCVIRLYVKQINTSNYVITRAGSDVMKGGLVFGSDNASNAELGFETTSAANITLNGTTQGGAAIGDYIELLDAFSGVWLLNGRVTESGSEQTPFS